MKDEKLNGKKDLNPWFCPECGSEFSPCCRGYAAKLQEAGLILSDPEGSKIHERTGQIWAKILRELVRAEGLHPGWVLDPIHGAVIIQEEVGELAEQCLKFVYESANLDRLKKMEDEAVQVAAMAVRFLLGVENYGLKWG